MDNHLEHNHSSHHRHDENEVAANHHEHHPAEHTGHQGTSGDHGGHGDHVDHTGHEIKFRNRFWVSLGLSIPVLLFSGTIQSWLDFSIPPFPGSAWVTPVFSVVIFFYGGLLFIQMARPEVKKRQPGMMTLISLAISVSFIYSLSALLLDLGEGFFWELVTLIDVMLVGHWLEMRSVRQASGALDELAKLMPDEAERILGNGDVETVRVQHLRMGDLVLVRPGTSVPVDGEVVDGASQVDESMITGESKPVDKESGDFVIGGTINGSGSLRVRVNATGDETALAGIMRLVSEAQQSKSQTQLLADKAAGWLFYIAIGVAAVTAVGWALAEGLGLTVLQRVVTVLVIACPHALGLAIPLVVAISTSTAARSGILVRDRLALENARLIDTIIFDKTGTLTKGKFGVVGICTSGNRSEEEVLALAAGIETDSEHIIAQGIRAAAEEKAVAPVPVTDFEAIEGRGVKAHANGKIMYFGGPRLLEMLELPLSDDLQDFTRDSGGKGHTVVYLIEDERILAAFALADLIREESYQAVRGLQEMGIEVAMLTGDSKAVAESVAEELGIRTFFAEVLPEHKDQKVAELRQAGKQVAMVGDGVNDAPALTRADVGIAIGSGTDVAVESAGIILVKSDPLDILNIFKLSRATYRKMIENLIWATGYNVVALPLAAGVLAWAGVVLSPAVGAVFMSLSTVIVAINAQLLRRVQLA